MHKLYHSQLLVENVLLLDGLSRAGKFLLGKVVSHFDRTEYFQYIPVVEHLPLLSFLKKMSREDALAYTKVHINLAVYERAIGRNLNLRVGDGSALSNAYDFATYDERRHQNDGIEAIERLKSAGRIPSFILHECLPHMDFFFELSPQLKVINLQRHPVDLVYSWFQRGWGERFGLDPLAFIPVVETSTGGCPWYAASWSQDYEKMSPMDRCIRIIVTLFTLGHEQQQKLKKNGRNILFVSYEDFMRQPEAVVRDIGHYLQASPFPDMPDILKAERCPRDLPLADRVQKLEKIKQNGSSALVEELLHFASEYEKRWEQEPLKI